MQIWNHLCRFFKSDILKPSEWKCRAFLLGCRKCLMTLGHFSFCIHWTHEVMETVEITQAQLHKALLKFLVTNCFNVREIQRPRYIQRYWRRYDVWQYFFRLINNWTADLFTMDDITTCFFIWINDIRKKSDKNSALIFKESRKYCWKKKNIWYIDMRNFWAKFWRNRNSFRKIGGIRFKYNIFH